MNKTERLTQRLALRERWFADASKENRKLKQEIRDLENKLRSRDDTIHYLRKEIDMLVEWLVS